jgi:hypothetical protein
MTTLEQRGAVAFAFMAAAIGTALRSKRVSFGHRAGFGCRLRSLSDYRNANACDGGKPRGCDGGGAARSVRPHHHDPCLF